MTPELYQRLKPLYEAALDKPGEQRAQFVADSCGDDSELRVALEALLENNDRQSSTLEKGFVDVRPFFAPAGNVLPEGEVLLGQFKIVRLLGSGGMGDVYEAIDLELGRIALKTIRPALSRDPAILARFKEEVLLARQVNGPNVCRIHQLYVPPKAAGCPCAAFLIMEYLKGVTLADRITKDGPVAPKEALRIATQLCAALQAIHDAGIVHRDLKPRNIMLVPRNGVEQVVVMDFGLARAVAKKSSSDDTGLTIPGTIMGTPAYMAPEQFEGGEVSPATDIYALGILLYELVTGQQPFAAPTPFGAAVRRGRQPDSASSIRKGVPPVWDDVITRCIEYEPKRRYQSAAEVLAAFHQHTLVVWRFSHGQRIALTPRVATVTGAILIVLLSVFGWSLYRALHIYTPPPMAKRWYDDGVAALRDGTYLKAANALGEAVKADPHYALAHARLADAWAELDSTGQAQQEMLLATDAEQRISMPDEDKRYVDAVQATLIRNYSAAAQDYEDILNRLPNDRRADGLVDLGRAYEKAGKIKETISSYEQAAKLNPDDPAPFVHIGIWKSRQRDPAGAEAAFTRAEELYRAKSNPEGLAEVSYQRGYAANEAADSAHAHEYLDESLDIARQIDSPQLEARTLTQLSSVEYNDSKDNEAIADANKAIQIARDNNLEYWSTDGLMRLGNAYLDKLDFANAETDSQLALGLARQNQHPRLEADAAFTLASVRDQQGDKWDEQIALAQRAMKYYRDFGFLNMAAASSILVVRGEERKGNFAGAVRAGTELLQLAEETHSQISIENAEGALGAALFGLEDYPAALLHFQKALQVGRSLHENESYEELNCAGTLWRLGRYTEAEGMLASISAEAQRRDDIGVQIENARAQMRLSRGDYRHALSDAKRAVKDFPAMPVEQVSDFGKIEVLAEAQLGQNERAQRDAEQLLTLAHRSANPDLIAQAELAKANVSLRSPSPQETISMAEDAEKYFSSQGETESEWLTLLYLAKAEKVAGDNHASLIKAQQAIDILHHLEQSWGSQVFTQYAARPDYQIAIHELSKLTSA